MDAHSDNSTESAAGVAPSPPDGPLLEIRCLKTHFHGRSGVTRAVDGVDLVVRRGKTLGLVGESGSGKSVTARSIMRLIKTPPGKIEAGEMLFRRPGGIVDLARLEASGETMRQIRGGEIAMIFQEPMTSLNPIYTVGSQIAEAVRLHQGLARAPARERAQAMLEKVQIGNPEQRLGEYPHQLSGGMRQRVMIAMGLSCNPSMLIADEPTTALDVTVQAEILDLLRRLQDELGTGIILITHNLGVIAQTADEVAVMYLGKLVECAEVKTFFASPLHPYSIGLLNSVPVFGRRKKRLDSIGGRIPESTAEVRGCAFAPRCGRRKDECDRETPALKDVGGGHQVACWLH